ncbi:MMPL family transporter [Corynebacterium testudinoris]|uniref:Putative RND superfamily drug exporter n=1 Tax=Corynebacterium testudinoris TaxID=136857 RepID=A0A0G3H936_9CORY|nr:MMPL family transporter [Corynebacterium testudinoris]AKK07652.1 putative RND superfamily drug exporter [Corynebacterium testudinoris]MBX8996059.1 MMPL family transporter [Corynebacterium testudinoris]
MAKFLFKLGRWSFHKKWIVIVIWVGILAGIAGGAMAIQKPFSSQFTIGGTPSIEAISTLQDNFPDAGNPANAASVNVVFVAPEGEELAAPENSAAIDTVVTYIRDNLHDISNDQRFGNPVVLSPALEAGVVEQMTQQGLPEEMARQDAANLRMISPDGRIGYTTFDIDVPSSMDVTQEHRDVVNHAMDLGREQGLEVEAGGAGFGDPISVKTTSELIGLAIAFVVLIFTFGSLVAAGLPLLTAVIGVGIGALVIVGATRFVELNDITPVLAVMIGLAVGIDYALFILSRYRAERERMPADEAAGMAVGTAGSAVVFAGATVIIALAALTIVNIGFLTAMGLSAAFTVLVAVLVALTFIPALLGVLGDRTFKGRIPGVAGNPMRKGKRRPVRRTLGNRWVSFVRRAPGLVMAVVVLGLGALSAPVLNMELSLPSDSTSNLDTTQRKSADLMAEGFGPGINAPFLVIVDAHDVNPDSAALEPLVRAQTSLAEANGEVVDREKAAASSSFLYTVGQLKSVGGVKHAQIVGVNDDSTAAQVMVTPVTGPDEQYTTEVSHALRAQSAEISDATGVKIGMTGLTAVQMDITERLSGAMPIYLAIVVGLAIFLLFAVFRSVLVPIVAGLGFLLSVGAAFGVTVLVWQQGLWGLVNTPAPLISFMPIFLIGVTFGLAMDYQVFLVTRMREHYITLRERAEKAGDTDVPLRSLRLDAVEESTIVGFTRGARVVTAAALIMIAVFIAFIDQPLPFIQIFGFALGFGVLFDAFFIRMSLVPATMFLMGSATWWIPKWLDRLIPRLDIEGTELEKEWEARHAAEMAHRKEMDKVTS